MFDALGHGRVRSGLRPFPVTMAIFLLGNAGLAASGGAGWLIAAIAAANIALAGVAVGRRLAVRDLPGRDRALRRIEHLASHDTLTDLSNRAHFTDALDDAVDAGEPFALLALDLDRFKAVNDIFGHGAGDAILCRVADMLRAAVRGTDIVARVGGDEFLIIQVGISGPDDARKLANRILDTVSTEMDRARDPMAVGVSIGVALFPRDGADAGTIRRNADIALYRAKADGRGGAALFDRQMDRVARERRTLDRDLRLAVARNELYLEFQPLVAAAVGSVVGYEALLRWRHPRLGEIAPEAFLSVAEETGAIVPIGEWMLRQACTTAATWPDTLAVAVKISAVQLRIPNFVAVVRDALDRSGLDGHRLELEIPEAALLRNRQRALQTLHEIRASGVRIAMDEFGTGPSSLGNLKAFPFDKIRIDRSFVAAMRHDAAASSIVRAIVGLGRSFNVPIVAEGVETDEQRRILLDAGCPQAQGYFFGRPGKDPFGSTAQRDLSPDP